MSLGQIKRMALSEAIVAYGRASFDLGNNTDPLKNEGLTKQLNEARQTVTKLVHDQHDALHNLVIMLPSVQGVPADKLRERIGPAFSYVRWIDVKEARETLGMEV